jgi:ubiquinone/menaquinone biosynthesis C-methylase UbiE
MIPLRRKSDPHALSVGMAGTKLGDHVVQIGCADGGRLAAIASKVGLSGRAVAVVPDDASAALARKGASRAGVLVEVEIAPPTRLPLEDVGFDLAIVDDTGGLFGALGDEPRGRLLGELRRVLRPGGRAMVIGTAPQSGLSALLSRGPRAPQFDALPPLAAAGFKAPRLLAEREGLRFVEAVAPRAS